MEGDRDREIKRDRDTESGRETETDRERQRVTEREREAETEREGEMGKGRQGGDVRQRKIKAEHSSIFLNTSQSVCFLMTPFIAPRFCTRKHCTAYYHLCYNA